MPVQEESKEESSNGGDGGDDDNDDIVKKSDDVFIQNEKKGNRVFVVAADQSKMNEGIKKHLEKQVVKNKKQQLIHFKVKK